MKFSKSQFRLAWFFFSILFLVVSCRGERESPKKRKAREETNSVFRRDAIVADHNFYTRAVLEYNLMTDLIARVGTYQHYIDPITDSEDYRRWGLLQAKANSALDRYKSSGDKADQDMYIDLRDKANQLQLGSGKLFMDLPNYSTPEKYGGVLAILEKYNIPNCEFPVPVDLDDLKSGFQFRHYAFSGTDKAAMQAFGITDTEYESSSQFLVTDYIQFQDCKCAGLPKIRYAVGIRSQLKISRTEVNQSIENIGGLSGLAAQAELGRMEVDISVRTIGMTGLASRFNIPKNVSFDVDVYKDFQNLIDFVRHLQDSSDSPPVPVEPIEYHPELIPVMDEYRTTFEHSFNPYYESIQQTRKQYEKFQKKVDAPDSWVNADTAAKAEMLRFPQHYKGDLNLYMYIMQSKSILDRLEFLDRQRVDLVSGNQSINDFSKYNRLYEELNNLDLKK